MTPVADPEPLLDDDVAAMIGKLKKLETQQKLIDLFKLKAATPAPVNTEVVQVTKAGQILLAGFVCKLVPRCPDPDLNLTWS